MAEPKATKSWDEVKIMPVTTLRKEYRDLAAAYNALNDGTTYYCHRCGQYLREELFYVDARCASGRFPICKRCVLEMVEQRKNRKDEPNETKESVQKVLQLMDLPYDDAFYETCKRGVTDGTYIRAKSSVFTTYITAIKGLTQWKGKTWKNSDFGNDTPIGVNSIGEPRPEIKKIFGAGFPNEDYLFLQDQYDDWRSRTQVDTKPQETLIVQICFKQLELWKAQREGRDTTQLVKALNDLMSAANLQPKQNVNSATSEGLTFGQLIEKWEEGKPIPEPSEEFKDVDGIGHYLRVWFAGHLAKALGLRNAYSKEYEDEIQKYTVTKPEAREDGTSEDIYNTLFGKGE